ncbi:MAG: serine/threonine protein kinase [Polyangiaceae bacterium]|nr:serine/threonine protein kinase [Polyangiaceae bacterium]
MVEGELLTPNLRLVRPLGRAGSHVWVAHFSTLDREVAVKALDRPLARHSPQLHRFQREAEVAGHIKSAHVAQVLEHGVTATGLPYLVMELLEGEDLASRLKREGPMSLAEVGRLVFQVARGLGKAHLLGLVHRNLTPANVFLANAPDGGFDVKVLDVGLSSSSDLAMGGRVPTGAPADLAPPEYASPEQVFGVKDVDFRADLWAIAIVAYRALTGCTPFRATNPDAFAKAIDKAAFEPPSTIVPTLPPAIDAWFVKALQRDPAARFGGAKELADEFGRAAGIEHPDRLVRASFLPPMSVKPGRGALTSAAMLSGTGSATTEAVTVIGANRKNRTSSALLIAILAVIGIGTVIAGLSLMNH